MMKIKEVELKASRRRLQHLAGGGRENKFPDEVHVLITQKLPHSLLFPPHMLQHHDRCLLVLVVVVVGGCLNEWMDDRWMGG